MKEWGYHCDVVRCRETLQREVLKSRHYILKFLARRGYIYRDGVNCRAPHYVWLRHLAGATSPLASDDRLVLIEYVALLEYKLSRRDALDVHIEALALTPAYASAVATLQCFRGLQVHSAMVLATECPCASGLGVSLASEDWAASCRSSFVARSATARRARYARSVCARRTRRPCETWPSFAEQVIRRRSIKRR